MSCSASWSWDRRGPVSRHSPRRLSDMTGLPFVSLDALYWKPGWQHSEKAPFEASVTARRQSARAGYMDGNFTSGGAGLLRRQLADTVIWFDLPRRTCMIGILTRIASSYGEVRPEMAEGCPEKIDFEFFHYVWTYRSRQRPKLPAIFRGAEAGPGAGLFHRTGASRPLSRQHRARRSLLMPRFSSKRRVRHTAEQIVRSGGRRRALSGVWCRCASP